MKFNHSVFSGSDEGRLWRLLCTSVHHKTQHLLSLFGADIVSISSNGRLQLLTQGCVYANRAASQDGRDFFPLMTWTEGESETAHLENLFVIYWFYKKKELVDF